MKKAVKNGINQSVDKVSEMYIKSIMRINSILKDETGSVSIWGIILGVIIVVAIVALKTPVENLTTWTWTEISDWFKDQVQKVAV